MSFFLHYLGMAGQVSSSNKRVFGTAGFNLTTSELQFTFTDDVIAVAGKLLPILTLRCLFELNVGG